jgi:hypothetical protein
MESLTNLILRKMSIQQLFEIYYTNELLDIEEEVGRRLSSYDVKTIDFLYSNPRIKWLESSFVRNGILNAMKVVPWRIGVIYNYQDESFRLDNLLIVLGNQNYQTSKGMKFIPTWLDSRSSKLVLREVVSQNLKTLKNSVITSDTALDSQIRNVLINNNSVIIGVCTFIPANQSYDQKLPGGELKTMYPCTISSGNFQHNLVNIPIPPVNVLNYNVNITKSEDYQKLLNLINFNLE